MLWSSSSVQPCLPIVSGRAALNSAGCRKSTTFCDLSYLTIYNLDVKLYVKGTYLSSYLSDTSLSFWTSCATLASTPLASSAIVKPSSRGALLSLEATTALLLACLWFPTCNCSLRRPTLLMPCFQSQDVSHTQWFWYSGSCPYEMSWHFCLAVTLDYWTTPWNLLLPRAQTSFYTIVHFEPYTGLIKENTYFRGNFHNLYTFIWALVTNAILSSYLTTFMKLLHIGTCVVFHTDDSLSSSPQIFLVFPPQYWKCITDTNNEDKDNPGNDDKITLAFQLVHFLCDTGDTCDNSSWREGRGLGGCWGEGGRRQIGSLQQALDHS